MNNYRTNRLIAFWSIYFNRTELSLVHVNQPLAYLILQLGKIFMSSLRSSTQEPMHSDSISSISPKYIFHIIFRSQRETAGARPVVHFTRHTNSIETKLEFHRIPYDMLAFLTHPQLMKLGHYKAVAHILHNNSEISHHIHTH